MKQLLLMTLLFFVACDDVDRTDATGATPAADAALIQEPEAWVFILSGQSNMVGRGDNVDQYKDYPFFQIPSNALYFAEAQNVTSHAGRNPFGPELTLIYKLATTFPLQKMIFIKYAVDGTTIEQWNAGLRVNLLNYVKTATQGQDVKFKGFFWMQGENNTINPSPTYADLVLDMFNYFKTNLQAPELRFIVARIKNYTNNTFDAVGIIRTAQERVVAIEPNSKLISTDLLTLLVDNIHFDGLSHLAFGACFAKAFVEDQDKQMLTCPARYVDTPLL